MLRIKIRNNLLIIVICIIYIFLYIPNEIKYILRWLRSLILRKKFNPINQEIPWITFGAKKWLDYYLKPNMSLFEFGCGGSTLYFSKKVKELVSIENDKKYYNQILKIMKQKKISNCDLQLIEHDKKYYNQILKIMKQKKSDLQLIKSDKKYYNQILKIIKQKKISNSDLQLNKKFILKIMKQKKSDLQLIEVNGLNKSKIDIYNSSVKKYAMSISKFPNRYFDLILIDGPDRNLCIKYAINKIKHGGFLMLDNSTNMKYQEGINILNKYTKVDFLGIGPSLPIFFQTSIWKIK